MSDTPKYRVVHSYGRHACELCGEEYEWLVRGEILTELSVDYCPQCRRINYG